MIPSLVSYGNMLSAYNSGVPLVEIIAEIGGQPYWFGEIDRCDDDVGALRIVKNHAEIKRFGPEDILDLYAIGIVVGNGEREYLGRAAGRNVALKVEEFNSKVACLRKRAYDVLVVLADSEKKNEIAGYSGTPLTCFSLPEASELVTAANEIFR